MEAKGFEIEKLAWPVNINSMRIHSEKEAWDRLEYSRAPTIFVVEIPQGSNKILFWDGTDMHAVASKVLKRK